MFPMIKQILKRFLSVTELKCKTTKFSDWIEYLWGNADSTLWLLNISSPGATREGGETYLLRSGSSSFIHLVIKRIIVNLFLNKPN